MLSISTGFYEFTKLSEKNDKTYWSAQQSDWIINNRKQNTDNQIFGHRHLIYSIDLHYEKILVRNESTFKLAKTVEFFSVGCFWVVSCYIYIPPSSIIVHAVPSVPIYVVLTGYSVNIGRSLRQERAPTILITMTKNRIIRPDFDCNVIANILVLFTMIPQFICKFTLQQFVFQI